MGVQNLFLSHESFQVQNIMFGDAQHLIDFGRTSFGMEALHWTAIQVKFNLSGDDFKCIDSPAGNSWCSPLTKEPWGEIHLVWLWLPFQYVLQGGFEIAAF